jgi:hypothetical protein
MMRKQLLVLKKLAERDARTATPQRTHATPPG